MLREALRYESLGLSVIPLRPKGKEPLYKWTEFQGRRATTTEIEQWWSAVPNANIGIVTGRISNLAVIDLDGPEGAASSLSLGLTSNVVSLTGNGKHLWYSMAGNAHKLIVNAVRVVPGIDIRAEGGYVVAPPSISPNGRRYRFINALTSVANLPLFPMELMQKQQNSIESGSIGIKKSDSWIANAIGGMTNGNIDDTLFSICSRMRADNWSAADARAVLEPIALAKGATPGHLDEKIENVWNRYEPNKSTSLRLYQTGEQSRLLPSEGLIIHSPTNPDSLKQYRQRKMDTCGTAETLQTGYSKLDGMFKGGLKSSRLLVIAARTGVGKTNILLAIAKYLCQSGKRVLLFSTEMPYQQIWERYIATLEDPEEFKSHKFYVCDSFAPNLEKVEEAINAIKPDVFMFDHINHVSEEVKGLGEFMQGLNYLRRKYDTAGIVTAQLNRSADWVDLKTGEKVTPRMSMIKGSGTIEQASSRVLLLSETRVTPEGTEIVGNLDKNDNGDKGLIHFMLKRNPYRMTEL